MGISIEMRMCVYLCVRVRVRVFTSINSNDIDNSGFGVKDQTILICVKSESQLLYLLQHIISVESDSDTVTTVSRLEC